MTESRFWFTTIWLKKRREHLFRSEMAQKLVKKSFPQTEKRKPSKNGMYCKHIFFFTFNFEKWEIFQKCLLCIFHEK